MADWHAVTRVVQTQQEFHVWAETPSEAKAIAQAGKYSDGVPVTGYPIGKPKPSGEPRWTKVRSNCIGPLGADR